VAKKFSDDLTYIDNPIWVTKADLPEIYESVKDLKIGAVSDIRQVAGAYVIWQVKSEIKEVGQEAKELKAILVQAKSIDAFLAEFLAQVEVKKTY
jgi:hypothetical protein